MLNPKWKWKDQEAGIRWRVVTHAHDDRIGACLLKNAASGGLGNIADASLEHWGASVKRVMSSFPDAKIVIPGHGGWEPGAAGKGVLKWEWRPLVENAGRRGGEWVTW